MNNSDIFSVVGVTHENDISNNTPLISFHTQEQKDIAELYVREEANDFFTNILKIDNQIQCIPYSKTINLQKINEIEIKYFYETLFLDLCERDSSGKLINKLKWGVTFDAEIAPIQTASSNEDIKLDYEQETLSYLDKREGRPSLPYYSPNGVIDNPPFYRRYGVITLNGEAVFYYLYFTLQEILDAIKRKRTKI